MELCDIILPISDSCKDDNTPFQYQYEVEIMNH